MPGTSSDSRLLRAVGVAVFLVAVAGSTLYGWEFDAGTSDPLPLALGVACAAIALGVVLLRRR